MWKLPRQVIQPRKFEDDETSSTTTKQHDSFNSLGLTRETCRGGLQDYLPQVTMTLPTTWKQNRVAFNTLPFSLYFLTLFYS
jgi:hypothetical protein